MIHGDYFSAIFLDETQEEVTMTDDEGLRCMLEECHAQGTVPKIIVKAANPAPAGKQ